MATSLIPDGTIDTFPFVGDKVTTMLQGIRTTDSGATYSSFTPTFSTITNSATMTNEPSGNVVFMSATTANEPTETVPKEVLKVLDKVVASNSHSLYKDNLIANAISGGVATGNGINPYESKVLENVLLDENKAITTIPKHTPIELDNSNSKASKWFYALSVKDNQYYIDIYYKELVWNGVDSYDDNGQFDDLSKCLSIPTGVYRK